jgi:adhesin transport system membrane fusion protein
MMAADKKKSKKQPTVDANEEWKALREGWAAGQVSRAHAHLLAKFDTDEEMPLSRHLLLLSIAAFFILFFIWANLAPLDEVARGEGKIIPSGDVQSIQREESGIIEEILVREGDEVTKDQILMRLSDIAASSDLGANQARYLGLMATITRLQAEAEGKTSFEFSEDIVKNAPSSVTEEMNYVPRQPDAIAGAA